MANEFKVKNGIISEGNIVVSGSIVTTGTVTISGSIASASYATNAEFLDNMDSTMFTFTSSFNTVSASLADRATKLESTASILTAASGTLNTRVTSLESTASILTAASASLSTASGSLNAGLVNVIARTGSFATTGSNVFYGNQTVSASMFVSGSITATGQIVAQTINVQSVTSSVVYSSGSNVFGNSLSDTQRITGSVLITGSLSVVTNGTELAVGSTGVALGNALTDVHNVTGSMLITGSLRTIGNICATTICSPTYVGGTVSGSTIQGTTLFASTVACSPVGCFTTSCASAFIGGTFSGTTIAGTTLYGSTAVCAPTICGGNVCGTTGCFGTTCSPSYLGGTFSGTTVSGTTLYGSTAVCAPTICGGNVCGTVGCFGTICSPTHIGGTFSGTTISGTSIYGSTIVCSPIGCFATSCATSFIGGTVSGTTIYSSTTFCGPSICTIDSRACTLRMACTIVPLTNYRTSDCGYGGIDFFDNGKGYACSAKFYTFKSVTNAEYYGFTNDYNGTAQLALVSCGGGGGENISFFTGTSTTARLRIDNNASCFSQTICSPTVIGSSIVCSAASVYAATNIRVGSGTSAGNASDPAITTGGCTKTGIYFAGSCVALGSGGNSLLLAQNGNVGIGITNPSRKFQVMEAGTSTSGNVMAIRNDCTTSGAFINFIAGGANAPGMGAKGNDLVFTADGYSGTELMRITSVGSAVFNCNGTYCSNYGYNFLGACNGSIFSGGHVMGNVGAGTTCATPFWCLNGGVGGAFRMEFNWSSGAETQWINHNNCTPFKLVWSADNSAAKYCFGYNGNFWACNTICAPAGVKYGNGSTTLNYYEEGSWTPALQNSTVSYSERSGTYVRIGNHVFVRWGFRISSISGQSSTVTISGLPFTAANYGSYQEPNVSVSTGVLATADYAQRARLYKGNSDTSMYGRIANNSDTAWDTSQLQNGSWIIGEIFYNV